MAAETPEKVTKADKSPSAQSVDNAADKADAIVVSTDDDEDDDDKKKEEDEGNASLGNFFVRSTNYGCCGAIPS